MKKISICIFISVLSVFSGNAQGIFNTGDEQGLETGKLDLKQDSVALLEALNGWWAESQKTLDQCMDWYSEAKFGCFIHWGATTRKGDRLYLHIYQWPKDGKLVVGGLSADIDKAYLIANKNEVTFEKLGDKDMLVRLPAACPDTVNTVVALQLKNTGYQTDDKRLLVPGEKNILLTFDAQLSNGLSTGDGKQYRNYVHNWTRADQSMTWNVRLLQPASYRISVEYNKENSSDAGTVVLEINGKPYKASYTPTQRNLNSEKLFITTVDLVPGEHTIILKGEHYGGKQYMRPMQLIFCQQTWKDKTAAVLKSHVLAQADGWLEAKPETVTAHTSDRSAGSRHDFFSEGDYWWPDPTNPDGPYIQRDGETNPDNFVAHRHAMIRFSRIAGAMASAYLLTGDEKYARQVMLHAKAWFVDTATMMNPGLLYAQAIKGRVTGRGIGIIDTIHLMEVAQALLKIRNATCVDAAGWETIRQWFANYLSWLMTHPYSEQEKNAANNHATCWVMQVASFAKLTGDRQILEMCRNHYREVLLPSQMAEDGSFPREINRTKPYGYSLFNLDAMATICQILSDTDHDLWYFTVDNGKNIFNGIEFLYPYTADKNKWPHRKDVLYWNKWPVAHPFLIFGTVKFNRQDWFDLWASLDCDPQVDEVLRNLPVRNPLIWME